MENFNKGFDSFKGGNRSNNENEVNPEMITKIKSPGKNQLPTKNFMSPTISASIKASVPRKKILGERNETLDALEQPSLHRSTSFGSKPVKSPVSLDSDAGDVVVGSKPCLQPYDPVQNYLSPRPKFLRYNPNRRRKISNLQESDEDGFKISTYFDEGSAIPPSDLLQPELGNSASLDSCSRQESAGEDENVNVEEDEDATGKDDDEEEEMVEFQEEEKCCSLKGFFKFLFVVIAVILTTQAICSMNSPSPLQTLESVWGVNHLHNHVYGFNFSEVGEQDFLVGILKEVEAYSHSDRLEISEIMVEDAKPDDRIHQDELQNDDSNVIQDELSLEHESDYVAAETVHDINKDGFTEEVGFGTANDMQDGVEEEVDGVEAATVLDFNQDALTEEDDSHNDVGLETANDMEDDAEEEVDGVEAAAVLGTNQDALTEEDYNNNVGLETANDMEDGVEEEADDIKPNELLIKFTSFDTTTAVLIGHLLILTSFCVIYYSKSKKSLSSVSSVTTPVEKEESEDLKPSTNLESMTQQKEEVVTAPPKNEISEVHKPSVHLLGEFVFGEEITSSSNISAAENHSSSSLIIQTTADSFSHMEMSSGESQTVKKQRRKNAEVVTPSPVRRSSRLKSRSSIMSP